MTVGSADRPATASELDRMRGMLADGLAAGAVGMSSGLTYTPGMYADTAELEALCPVVAEHGGYWAPHTRGYGRGALDGVRRVHRHRPAHRMRRAPHARDHELRREPRARRRAARAGRRRARRRRRRHARHLPVPARVDDARRAAAELGARGRTRRHARRGSATPPRASGCAWSSRRPAATAPTARRSTGTRSRSSGVQDAALADAVGLTVAEWAAPPATGADDAALELMRADRLGTGILMHIGDEDNVRAIMRHPRHSAGSDGILVGARPHPRAWGTFARYLGHYVRELGVLTLEECVRHLAGTPARRLGLTDRGVVREGAIADLVLFDAATVVDRATFEDPRQPAAGIVHVLVGGEFAVRDGVRTGVAAGRVLRLTDLGRPGPMSDALVYAVHMLTDLRDGRAGTALFPGDAGWGEDPPAYVPPGDPAVEVTPETPEQVAEALRLRRRRRARRRDPRGRPRRSAVRPGRRARPEPEAVRRRRGRRHRGARRAGRPLGRRRGGAGRARPGPQLRRHQERRCRRAHPRRRRRLAGARAGSRDRQPRRAGSCCRRERWSPRAPTRTPSCSGRCAAAAATSASSPSSCSRRTRSTASCSARSTSRRRRLADALRGWRDVMRDAPEELNGTFLAMPAMGPEMAGRANSSSSSRVGMPRRPSPAGPAARDSRATVSDDIAAKDYADALDEAHPFEGAAPTITRRTAFADDFSDAAIDAIVGGARGRRRRAHGALPARRVQPRAGRCDGLGARDARGDDDGGRVPASGADRARRSTRSARSGRRRCAFMHGTYGNFAEEVGDGDDRADVPAGDTRAAARGEADVRPAEPAEPQPEHRALEAASACSCSTSCFASARPRFV